jgi:mitofusin
VSKALSEEIRRLSVLVDEFNLSFQPEQHDLNMYKMKLNHHVKNGLGSNLHARLSTELAMDFEKIQQEMTGNE